MTKLPPSLLAATAAFVPLVLAGCGGGGGGGGTGPSTPNPTAAPTTAPTAGPIPTPVPATTARIVYVSNRGGNPQIYIMNPDGSGQTRLTITAAANDNPSISLDGRKIVFTSNRDGNGSDEIYSMNSDGTDQTRLTSNSVTDFSPAWSPDGSRIAFTSFRDNARGEIYVMNANGSGVTRLTNNTVVDGSPAWSPDGSRIAFSTRRNGNQEIYTMSASNGSGQTRVTNNSGTNNSDDSPTYLSNGTLVFEATPNNTINSDIFRIGTNGANRARVAGAPGVRFSPSAAPDGSKIAFVSVVGNANQIFTINADGSGQTQLTDAEASSIPSWGR